MKILYWNIRGIANLDSKLELSNICRSHKPDFLCISEPMVQFDVISAIFWSSLNMQLVAVNNKPNMPSIWLFCSKDISPPCIISSTVQQITLSFSMDHCNCAISFVYASTSYIKRRDLWKEIRDINSSISDAWMLIGDFNAVLGAHEKNGGCPPPRIYCSEFQDMSDNCNLIHLNTIGSYYTWSNGWRSRGRIELRLDRSMCNSTWLDSWPVSNCSTLPRAVSDHNPLIFSAQKN